MRYLEYSYSTYILTDILMELDQLRWNLDNTLRHPLAILPSHISFHLED